MTKAGLQVRPGFVLPVAFFDPWITALRATSEWTAMQKDSASTLKQVNSSAQRKVFSPSTLRSRSKTSSGRSHQAITKIYKYGALRRSFVIARRGSRKAPVSLAVMKQSWGCRLQESKKPYTIPSHRALTNTFFYTRLNMASPLMNRVSQSLFNNKVNAESAGVAFSLNPINNCFDEVVINANFGLESLW